MTYVLVYLVGVAFGAFLVYMWAYGNVGRYHVAEGDDRSGWLHDGMLYVALVEDDDINKGR